MMHTDESCTDPASSVRKYLDNMRYQVTQRFCIFCFAIALFTIPPSLFAENTQTLLINCLGVPFYLLPLVIIFRSGSYIPAAQLLMSIAPLLVLVNAIAANYNFSLMTTVWYFDFIVFAGIVLSLGWAIAIAGCGFISVTIFSILHLTGVIPPDSLHSFIIGSPIALFFSFGMLLYLLTVYTRQRDHMIRDVVESSIEKSRLVGVMSHDMRNYLGAIIGISSIIHDDMTSDSGSSIAEHMKLIDNAATRAYMMVDEFALAARDLSDEAFFPEVQEMTGFISPIFQRYLALSQPKGIHFVMASDCEPGMVSISKVKFSRVLENLFSNALKFSRKGDTVTVSTKCSGGHVVITIADTGIGIPPELHNTLFNRYTKAGRTGTAGEKSIGLGLSIVKRIIEQHNGLIWFDTKVGQGTTFYIKLTAV